MSGGFSPDMGRNPAKKRAIICAKMQKNANYDAFCAPKSAKTPKFCIIFCAK
jgi:hypothetical protein